MGPKSLNNLISWLTDQGPVWSLPTFNTVRNLNVLWSCLQIFLFITRKKVIGCAVAIQIDQVWTYSMMRIFIFLSSCISTLWFNMQRYVSINVFSSGLSCVTITWRIFYPRKTDCSLVLQVSSDMQPVSMLMILLLLET